MNDTISLITLNKHLFLYNFDTLFNVKYIPRSVVDC